MDCTHCFFAVLLVNQHGDFDFRGGDHADIDASHCQRFKHFGGNAGV